MRGVANLPLLRNLRCVTQELPENCRLAELKKVAEKPDALLGRVAEHSTARDMELEL
jgi:hypothetical protein